MYIYEPNMGFKVYINTYLNPNVIQIHKIYNHFYIIHNFGIGTMTTIYLRC